MVLRGAVQGVGFRPFVYRLASEMNLRGWVSNTAQGVIIEVEGPVALLASFRTRVLHEKPALSVVQSLEVTELDPVDHADFSIRESAAGEKTALIMPDLATCEECRTEIFDPLNRRFGYPFTNCTNCGPRFSIIEDLPYDRANTSMRRFAMCPDCQAEYEDPRNRRFHAQPNACPVCGPHMELWSQAGAVVARQAEAITMAATAIRQGSILALKGLGGFQLLVDARETKAVARLRERKHREAKPFALMFPSLDMIRQLCEVSAEEERLLLSSAAPIVLLRRRTNPAGNLALSEGVAPSNPYLGIMLPYTPPHHLLLAELRIPLVATSGNLTDEPICIDEEEALRRLSGIADVFLVHNRPIVRQVDDSVARVILGREQILRRARGYAPLPILVNQPLPSVLAVGAHLKNAVAISLPGMVFVSQHIGDLDTPQACQAFRRITSDLPRLYDWQPKAVACDLHPDYHSTQFAQEYARQNPAIRCVPVQHHYAHVLSCMAENEVSPPALGVVWDGTGWGLDGTVWGGEFLSVTARTFFRVAYWRPFRLPGGESAIREPRRSALGLLYEMLGDKAFLLRELAPVRAFEPAELDILKSILARGLQSPVTTSVGRLFDVVAALVDRVQIMRFEGEAGMGLEFALDGNAPEALYPLQLVNRRLRGAPSSGADLSALVGGRPVLMIDWEPMIWGILEDLRRQAPVGIISAKFHRTLAEAVVMVAQQISCDQVLLTGGCFQNRFLTELTVHRLAQAGFRVYWHQRVPPNDGGLALGQVWAAARELQNQG